MSFRGRDPRIGAEPFTRVERVHERVLGAFASVGRSVEVAEQRVGEPRGMRCPCEKPGVELLQRAHRLAQQAGRGLWRAPPERDLAEPQRRPAAQQGHVASDAVLERSTHERLGRVELADPLLCECRAGRELPERDRELIGALRHESHRVGQQCERGRGLPHRCERRQESEVRVEPVHR